MKTAQKLFKTLTGMVGMNIAFDDVHGEPDETILKVRAATYGLVRTGVIAGDFITKNGLDKKYRKFVRKVDADIARIVEANNASS